MDLESPAELSAREREILTLVATGATNQQIAVRLSISINTVKAHLRNIFAKIGVESRTEATLWAVQQGLVAVPGAESGAQAAIPAEETAPLPAPGRAGWRLHPLQYAALALALVLVLAAALWPTPRTAAAAGVDPLIDQPSDGADTVALPSGSRWEARAQIPTPRGRFAQAQIGATVYAISGLTDDGWTDRVEIYDAATDSWSRGAAKPTAVANAGAAVVDGRVYVPGGLDASRAVSDILEVYDPEADTWTTAAPIPTALCAYAIAPYGQGFYLFGGWDGQRYLDTTWYYDAAADAWSQGPVLSSPRGFAAAVAVDDTVYLMGGYDGRDELALCEAFSPAAAQAGESTWTTRAPMRSGRAGHAAVVTRGHIYVIGGGWVHSPGLQRILRSGQ